MWKFLVKNQKIEVVEREILASDQIRYVQFRFTFDGDWKRLHKVVQFSQCDETSSIVLGVDGTSCYLPAELHAGSFLLSVFGYDAESEEAVRATTVPVTLHIRPSGFVGEEPPIPPTPDLYAQLLRSIQTGASGKSAYELAVENGFVGTVAEWLGSLKGDSLDASKFATNTALQYLQGSLQNSLNGLTGRVVPLEEQAHWHDNLNILASITSERLTAWDESPDVSQFATNTALQYLQGSLQNSLDGLTGRVVPLEEQAHCHDNLNILSSITEARMAAWDENPDVSQFATNTALQYLQGSLQNSLNGLTGRVVPLEEQTHSHQNHELLDVITAERMAAWDESPDVSQFATNTALQYLQGSLQNSIAMLTGQVSGNREQITDNASAISNTQHTLEALQAQLNALSGGVPVVTLFRSGSNALATHGEQIYTFYQDGYRSLAGFTENYPNFCSSGNDFALSYTQTDFNWGAVIYTMCVTPTAITPNKSILLRYRSGEASAGGLWLVRKPNDTRSPADTARYIYEQIGNGSACAVPFHWLQSGDTDITVLYPCEGIAAGEYFLAWKAVTDNTHPLIRTIQVLEVTK